MGTWAQRRPLHLSRYAGATVGPAESLDGITLRDGTIEENARRAAVLHVDIDLPESGQRRAEQGHLGRGHVSIRAR
jgi:hypothetical protein